MQPGTVYVHEQHSLVVFHEPSGYVAFAPRTDVLCARADEIRAGVATSFFLRSDPLWRRGVFTPRGTVAEACPEAEDWRDAVIKTLDRFVALPDLDRHFADLQAMWASGPTPEH